MKSIASEKMRHLNLQSTYHPLFLGCPVNLGRNGNKSRCALVNLDLPLRYKTGASDGSFKWQYGVFVLFL